MLSRTAIFRSQWTTPRRSPSRSRPLSRKSGRQDAFFGRVWKAQLAQIQIGFWNRLFRSLRRPEGALRWENHFQNHPHFRKRMQILGAAEKDGFRVPHFPASRPLSHFQRPSCAVTYGFGYSAPYPACASFGFPFQLGGSYLPYQPQAPQNAIYTNSVNANSNAFPNSTLAQDFSTIKIQPSFQNRNQSR